MTPIQIGTPSRFLRDHLRSAHRDETASQPASRRRRIDRAARTLTIRAGVFGCMLAICATGGPLSAQLGMGFQGSYASGYDLGVGARAELPLEGVIPEEEGLMAGLRGIASFDYFFPACGNVLSELDCSAWELNAGVALPLPVGETLRSYAGAGLGLSRYSVSVEDMPGITGSYSRVGLNLLGGIRFPLAGLSSFGEGRIEVGGAQQFVLTLGVLLGGNSQRTSDTPGGEASPVRTH